VSPRRLWRGVALGAVAALAALACVEDVTSPPSCPDYCPGGQIVTVESLLAGAIVRDSSFTGYRQAPEAFVMLAANQPGLESRPIFQTLPIATRLKIDTGSDTTTGPIVVDSARLTLIWLRRDTTTRTLRLELYRLPLGLDSTSTFAGLAPSFGAPLRVVNLDSLLALPTLHDSVTGDSILSRDSLRRVIVVSVKFDSAQAPFTPADSGKVAFGVRVTADSNATLVLGSVEAGEGPRIVWYNRVDSAGTLVSRAAQTRGLLFDSFVSNVAPVTLDSNLTIGGIPSTRTLLRFALPRNMRDSAQIIRATLLLVQAGPPPVLTGDTVFLQLSRLAGDVGAKSPLALDTIGARSPLFLPSGNDTVRVEVTTLLRYWQLDTTAAPAAFVRLIALDRSDTTRIDGLEGTTLTTLRFFSSRTPAFQPTLRVTYVPRIKFGAP
jgi:hypothetical protein